MTIRYRVSYGPQISRLMDSAELDAYLYDNYQQGGKLSDMRIYAVAQLGLTSVRQKPKEEN